MQSLDFARRRSELRTTCLPDVLVNIIHNYCGFQLEPTRLIVLDEKYEMENQRFVGIIKDNIYTCLKAHSVEYWLCVNWQMVLKLDVAVCRVDNVNDKWLLVKCYQYEFLWDGHQQVILDAWQSVVYDRTVYIVRRLDFTFCKMDMDRLIPIPVHHDVVYMQKKGQYMMLCHPDESKSLFGVNYPSQICKMMHKYNNKVWMLDDTRLWCSDGSTFTIPHVGLSCYAQDNLIIVISNRQYVIDLNHPESVTYIEWPQELSVGEDYFCFHDKSIVHLYLN